MLPPKFVVRNVHVSRALAQNGIRSQSSKRVLSMTRL